MDEEEVTVTVPVVEVRVEVCCPSRVVIEEDGGEEGIKGIATTPRCELFNSTLSGKIG